MGVFSHDGNRVISFLRPAGPTMTVLRAYASSGSRGALSLLLLIKSAKEGPVFSLSRKVVVRLRVGALDSDESEVGEEVAEGSGEAVA